ARARAARLVLPGLPGHLPPPRRSRGSPPSSAESPAGTSGGGAVWGCVVMGQDSRERDDRLQPLALFTSVPLGVPPASPTSRGHSRVSFGRDSPLRDISVCAVGFHRRGEARVGPCPWRGPSFRENGGRGVPV